MSELTERQQKLFDAIGDWTTNGRFNFYHSDLMTLLALILAYWEERGIPPEKIMNDAIRRQMDWNRSDEWMAQDHSQPDVLPARSFREIGVEVLKLHHQMARDVVDLRVQLLDSDGVVAADSLPQRLEAGRVLTVVLPRTEEGWQRAYAEAEGAR